MSHPERLGKYRVTGVLGEGAMGVVYRGFDPGIERVVALKTVRRALLDADTGGAMALRFRNEAQAAGRLAHPGIVGVYDYGDEDDVAYIAMEFVQGHTLDRFVANKVRFTDDDVLSVTVQLLDALEHAHSQGVWHRDIKPANILMTVDGRLKVADFGIGRIESAALTQVGTMVGTPAYMAPEQIRGGAIDRRVDIYSAGVLLYLLLVGRPPFVGSTESVIYRVVHEAPALPSVVPGCERPAVYDEVLAVALAKDPAHRYTTATAFKQALLAVAGRPAAPALSEATLVSLPFQAPAASPAPTGGSQRQLVTTASGTPTHWDTSVLHRVELALAHHVGPLAAVLVRRAARECADLPALVQHLAQKITDPDERAEFLSSQAHHTTFSGAASASAARSGAGPGRTAGSLSTQGTLVTSGNPGASQQTLSEELLAQSTRLLAARVGPIASVLVKRTAARTQGRDAFHAALLDAVSDPAAREALRLDLARLG